MGARESAKTGIERETPRTTESEDVPTISPDPSPTPPLPHSPTPPALTGLSTAEIEAFLVSLGQPRYRGRQVADWIYRRGAGDFEAMTDLPAALRRQLAAAANVGRPEVLTQTPGDDAIKYLLRLGDGQTVECVWLPYREWSSVCLSTQVGCAMACAFCATGLGGFTRNLTAGEIVAQFLLARANASRPVTHAVFMGMGEPMLNYDAVMRAAHLLNEECGIGARNLTLSTVGIVPGIRRLAQDPFQVNLALSLHGPDDATRARFMPVAARYPLPEVIAAIREYMLATHRKVTFEYLLMAGVNDSPQHASRLADLIHDNLRDQADRPDPTNAAGAGHATRNTQHVSRFTSHVSRPHHVHGHLLPLGVNLIPYNETGTGFRRPSEDAIEAFMERLKRRGIPVTRRLERGHEIAAACGQLRRPAGAAGYHMKPKG